MRCLSDVYDFWHSVLSVRCHTMSVVLSIAADNKTPDCDTLSSVSIGCWTTRDWKDRRRSSDHLKRLSQLSRSKDTHSHTLQSGKVNAQSHHLSEAKLLSWLLKHRKSSLMFKWLCQNGTKWKTKKIINKTYRFLIGLSPSNRFASLLYQALNQLFEKIMALDIDERHLLRLGHGEEELETEKDFSRWGQSWTGGERTDAPWD